MGIINIKPTEIQVGDKFLGFGIVQKDPIIESGSVWAEIGQQGNKPTLYHFPADIEIRTIREDK